MATILTLCIVALVCFLLVTSAILVRKVLLGLLIALFAYRGAEAVVKGVKHLHAKRNARKVAHRAEPVSGYSPRPNTIYC